jgi:hypothetical protein
MTVIEFSRQSIRGNLVLILLIGGIVLSAVWSVFMYASLTTVRHDGKKNEELLVQAQVENAELKDQLYQITDNPQAEALLQERGYVLDKNPSYRKVAPLASRN